jgi:hypothetical protein
MFTLQVFKSRAKFPSTPLRGRLSLRLKSGYARDDASRCGILIFRNDASRLTVGKVLGEIYVQGVDVLGAEVAEE